MNHPITGRLRRARGLPSSEACTVFREGKGRPTRLHSPHSQPPPPAPRPVPRWPSPTRCPAGGDPNILESSRGTDWGSWFAAEGYGKPSLRGQPGSVARARADPDRAGFRVVRAAAVDVRHRHAQRSASSSATTRLWDIDPSRHRLMLNGSELRCWPMVFTMDELMRLPTVSRASTSSSAAPTPAWNGATRPCRPAVHARHALSCSEFTGVPLRTLLETAGADVRRRAASCGRGADGSSMTLSSRWIW